MSKKAENKILTKDEAMVLLSAQLRNPKLEADLFIKVMKLYSTIAGWDNEPTPKENEPTIEDQVLALEQKRKQSNA